MLKEDVAEVLRRRFFVPESIRDREAFRPHVVAALKGMADHDEPTAKEGKSAEERFLKSYPFHPDLTEVLYTKWTQLEGFQRTRGVLRTFALALRDAVAWDQCPLVGANVFLSEPGKVEVSAAARELTNVAGSEEMEVVLPESAELSDIEPGLLASGVLPDLWTGSDVSVGDVRGYFSGGKVIKVARQGYDEPITIPKASQAVVDGAIGWAVKEGKLWLAHRQTSLRRRRDSGRSAGR